MKKYLGYKHKESECVWVPFWHLDNVDGTKTECTEMASNGERICKMTAERKTECEIVEITQEEFERATKNITLMQEITLGGIWEHFGLLFTCTALYELSNEYQKKHNLYHSTRVIENSPLYDYGALSYGIN